MHFRAAGAGPALLLLHQSPQNSRMWLGMMQRFADRYTVIAPDTPGFGYSDPLPGQPMRVADFGQATLELVEALGLERFAVFGMHTGGLIATWLAWAHPERVAALVVDGYAAFTPEESALYGEAYLPPFVPAWDGSHLRWLWARMREQKYFFPWYSGQAQAAMSIAPQTPRETHEAVRDVLDVGDAYRSGYAAAFRHNDHHWLAELRMPAWLVYRHGDPLLAHMPRLRDLAPGVRVVEEPGGIPAMYEAMDGWLAEALAGEARAALHEAGAEADGWSRRLVATAGGDLAAWYLPSPGPLNLVLHPPGEQPRGPARASGDGSAWLLPELPGHGASSEIEAEPTRDAVVDAVMAAVDGIGAGAAEVVLHAHGASAGYVPALAARLGARLAGVVLHAPWLLDEGERALLLSGLPSNTIDRAGGHVIDAWHWERERHLLWPWLPPGAGARRIADAPEPARVHANVVELLRLGPRLRILLEGSVVPGLAGRLQALRVPLRVVAASADDYRGRAAALSSGTNTEEPAE